MFVCVALSLTLALVTPASAAPIPVPSINDEVQGPTCLDVLTIAKDANDPWVVLQARPAPTSGIAGFTGSGKPGDPFKDSCRISGTYAVRNVLSGTVNSATGTYSWPGLIVAMTPATIHAMEVVSPFEVSKAQETATVACILKEAANDSTIFTSVYLVPKEWAGDLVSAVQTVRGLPGLTSTGLKDKGKSLFRAMLKDPNPYLALTAVAQLSLANELPQSDLDTILKPDDPLFTAAVISTYRVYGRMYSNNDQAWLEHKITSTTSLTGLEGIAIGMQSSAAIWSGNSPYAIPAAAWPYPATLYSTAYSTARYLSDKALFDKIRTQLNALRNQRDADTSALQAINTACEHYGT
jgi:hypothetical protein